MKIAVLVCGQPKFFDPCLNSQLDFFNLDGFTFDFFVHSWTNSSYLKAPGDKKTGRWLEHNLTFEKHTIEKAMSERYNPKQLLVSIIEDETIERDFESIKNILVEEPEISHPISQINNAGYKIKTFLDNWGTGQSFSIQRATMLYMDSCKPCDYDFCIKIRQDIFFDKHTEEEKKVFFEFAAGKKDTCFFYGEHGNDEVEDCVFFSTPEAFIKVFSDLYDFNISSIKQIIKENSTEKSFYMSVINKSSEPTYHHCLYTIRHKLKKENIDVHHPRLYQVRYPRYSIFRDYHMSCYEEGFLRIQKEHSKEWL